ncbi:Putative Zinc finger C2H2-type [Colletotrichum destructivum]|uniref:Zinc finger C2H2-type n=1 Tax=Colletotrichum destructivum TaxID=34406 RepID=A0AAX4HYV5_9PEZI|nr:Putative Zinc finger C2H2-type [Colletotrichum destructivum]
MSPPISLIAFSCATCWQTWPTWTSRNQHVDAKFLQIPDFECESCDRYFNRRKAVEQHMDALGHWADSTSDEPGQYCDFDACSEVFDDEELRDHDIEKHFYCDYWYHRCCDTGDHEYRAFQQGEVAVILLIILILREQKSRI